MRHVGDGSQDGVSLFLYLLVLFLQRPDLFAERLALGDQFLLVRRVFLLRDELGHFILALLDLLSLLFKAYTLVVEVNGAVHVGADAAVGDVGFDGVEMVPNEGCVQHGVLFRKSLVLAAQGVCVIAAQGKKPLMHCDPEVAESEYVKPF